MKKLFENTTTYSKDIYIEFLSFHTKIHNWSYTLYTIFWTALFILCIYLSFSSKNRFQGVVITIIAIGFVLYRFYHPKIIVNKELNSDKFSDNNTNTFSFFDKNFEIKNNNGSFIYRYIMLRKIFETPNFFYLYVTRENAFLISKDTFSLGTSEEFSNFIKNKCKFKYSKKLK